MPISPVQKLAIEEVMAAVLDVTTRGKRQLAAMFMDLVDRTEWPEYYEVGSNASFSRLVGSFLPRSSPNRAVSTISRQVSQRAGTKKPRTSSPISLSFSGTRFSTTKLGVR